MKLLIKPNDRHSLYNIETVITSAIERSGFNVVSKGNSTFGVMQLDIDGQSFVKTIVTKKCEQYGLEYEIND